MGIFRYSRSSKVMWFKWAERGNVKKALVILHPRGVVTKTNTFNFSLFLVMPMADITASITVASIVIFVAGLFVIMLYERERAKERKHAER